MVWFTVMFFVILSLRTVIKINKIQINIIFFRFWKHDVLRDETVILMLHTSGHLSQGDMDDYCIYIYIYTVDTHGIINNKTRGLRISVHYLRPLFLLYFLVFTHHQTFHFLVKKNNNNKRNSFFSDPMYNSVSFNRKLK